MHPTFFTDIPGFAAFADLTDPGHYHALPQDWHVVMTDVRGSTKAIAEGRYKEVNMVGAACIIAVINSCADVELPYVFGGDGATLLVPDSRLDAVLHALEAVQAQVQASFGLDLRAGSVPVNALYAQGMQLGVGKFLLSEHVAQAVFQGSALGLAEEWLKKGGGPVRHCTPARHDDMNLAGLECRWEPIENRNGSMISLLARVHPQRSRDSWRIYSELLRDIGHIYPNHQGAHPIQPARLRISLSPRRLAAEARLRAGRGLSFALYMLRIILLDLIGLFSFSSGKRVLGFDGKRYLSELAANSDVRKFDEMLRMVLDSTPAQGRALEELLERRRRAGEIVYGLHSSAQALMTCLVFSLAGKHIHFIDGADGGYALAAVQMKQQLATSADTAYATA